MDKDIVSFLNKLIHVYVRNLNILPSPLKNGMAKNLQLLILGTQFLNSSLDPDRGRNKLKFKYISIRSSVYVMN